MPRSRSSVSVLPQFARLLLLTVVTALAGSAACVPATNGTAAAPHPASGSPVSESPAATTVVLVRHAEKVTADPADRDPGLTDAGRERARALAEVLGDADVAAVYVTQYRRTRLTGEPTAERFGAPVRERACCDPNVPAWSEGLAEEVLREHPGETVLIVGHSNTIPDLVGAFSGHHPGPMTEAEYDHLFVVVAGTGAGAGEPTLLKARFGAAQP